MGLELRFLGTGTSVGVPMIGCDCPVCTSPDPRNRRRRSCLFVKHGDGSFVVDTPPDFREQMLEERIRRVDAVFFTHVHADHIFGFDDIRRFNTIQNSVIPAYGAPEILRRVHEIFDYIGETPGDNGLFRPLIRFCPMTEPVEVDGVLMTLLPVEHGGAPCYGYLMEADGVRVGYISDCSRIPESTLALLGDLDVMVLDALRYRPHPSHMCVAESVACLEKIGAKRSYLIHLCHDLDHGKLSGELPENMFVTYDGLRVTVDREGESAGEEQ